MLDDYVRTVTEDAREAIIKANGRDIYAFAEKLVTDWRAAAYAHKVGRGSTSPRSDGRPALPPDTEADMMEVMPELLAQLADAVVALAPERVVELARRVIAEGMPPELAINQGLAAACAGWARSTRPRSASYPRCCLPRGDVRRVRNPERGDEGERQGLVTKGKVVLGVVQGDIHDIGKNIVKVMTQAAGSSRGPRPERCPADFVRAVEQALEDSGHDPSCQAIRSCPSVVLGMSSLMTTTMPRMGTVIELLDKAGLRSRVKVLVGGAPLTAEFARRIGADSYAPTRTPRSRRSNGWRRQESRHSGVKESSESHGPGQAVCRACERRRARAAGRLPDGRCQPRRAPRRFSISEAVTQADVLGRCCILRTGSTATT